VVSSWVGWDRYLVLEGDEEGAALTEKEKALKEELQARLKNGQPTHRLVLKDGVVLTGRLLSQSETAYTFKEEYGDSGGVNVTIRRSRVRAVQSIPVSDMDLSNRDVRLAAEFPDFNFYRRHPYTLVTDESYFMVESTIQELQQLHNQFSKSFGPLLTEKAQRDHIQIVIFSDEQAFETYQKQYAPSMENSSGFYSSLTDRLVFFNQQGSASMKNSGVALRAAEKKYLAQARQYGGVQRVRQWARENEKILLQTAENETRRTIRHEGAHQLFYTLGIHSTIRLENTWLVEGLAAYCEPRTPGEVDGLRVSMLKTASGLDDLVPLDILVNSRSAGGFLGLAEDYDSALTYGQSWALVHMLLQPSCREGFFDYIRHVRDPGNMKSLLKSDRYQLLSDRVTQPGEAPLEERFKKYLARLYKGAGL
jgi:hypothetical protein